MNKTVTAIVVVIILVVGGFLVFSGGSDQPQEPTDQPATTSESMDDSGVDTTDTNQTPSDRSEEAGDTNTTTATSSEQSQSADAPAATVIYQGGQFSPQEVTIESGQTVRFESRGGEMWVGVDQHPTHTQYDGTSLEEHCQQEGQESFDQCGTGNTYSFTFDKAGEFGYHNHVNPSASGRIIVE